MTTITLRIPIDVVDSLKEIAPLKGLTAYQTLLKSYISEGLRRDEALLVQPPPPERIVAMLKKHGIAASVSDKIARELASLTR